MSSKQIIGYALGIVTISLLIGAGFWYVYKGVSDQAGGDGWETSFDNGIPDGELDYSIPPKDRIPVPSTNAINITLLNNSENAAFYQPLIIFHNKNFKFLEKGTKTPDFVANYIDLPLVTPEFSGALEELRQNPDVIDLFVVPEALLPNVNKKSFGTSFGPFTYFEDMYMTIFTPNVDTNDGLAVIRSVKIYDARSNKMVAIKDGFVSAEHLDAGVEVNQDQGGGFPLGQYDPEKGTDNFGNGTKEDGIISDHPQMEKDKEALRLFASSIEISNEERDQIREDHEKELKGFGEVETVTEE